jgi:hypothetical protein
MHNLSWIELGSERKQETKYSVDLNNKCIRIKREERESDLIHGQFSSNISLIQQERGSQEGYNHRMPQGLEEASHFLTLRLGDRWGIPIYITLCKPLNCRYFTCSS